MPKEIILIDLGGSQKLLHFEQKYLLSGFVAYMVI